MIYEESFYNFENHNNYVKHKRNPLRGKPGCYYVLHFKSKFIYIGSTQSLGDRIHKTFSSLKCNRHKNINLQTLYDEDNKIEIFIQPTNTIEEAQVLEQELVTKYKESGFLCNIATDDVILTALNRKLSDKHKEILINNNKTRIVSKSTRNKMANSQKQFLNTEKGKLLFQEKMEKVSRKITIEGKEYKSISEASRKLSIPYTSLVKKYGIQPRRKDT